jgi:pseudaminic acid synthase
MSKTASITIAGRRIGPDEPVYVIAEMSGNHNQSFEEAVRIIEAAKAAGADAVKLQTYTPDTITMDADHPAFRVGEGTLWTGKTLYQLYGEAYTPWDWQPKLKEIANKLGLHCFSSPFDPTAVDFLEKMDVPAYKVASFELLDLPLVEYMARTGKPMIMSTGMASVEEVAEAVDTARAAGCRDLVLLKCTSAYPAPPEEMNIAAIPMMAQTFGVPVGLSDHTLTNDAAIAAVALGACVVEKHFTLSRATPGPDNAFSLEPQEFKALVDSVATTRKAIGKPLLAPTAEEAKSLVFRRSLFVTEDVRRGEVFTEKNVRSIRPGVGLAPRHYRQVLGKKASRDIARGTPVAWDLLA